MIISFLIFLGEQIPPDGKSDHENDEYHIPSSEIICESPPKIAFETNSPPEITVESRIEFDTNFSPEIPIESNNVEDDLSKLLSAPPETFNSNSDQDSDFGDFESERNPNFEGFESERNWQDNSDYGGSKNIIYPLYN